MIKEILGKAGFLELKNLNWKDGDELDDAKIFSDLGTNFDVLIGVLLNQISARSLATITYCHSSFAQSRKLPSECGALGPWDSRHITMSRSLFFSKLAPLNNTTYMRSLLDRNDKRCKKIVCDFGQSKVCSPPIVPIFFQGVPFLPSAKESQSTHPVVPPFSRTGYPFGNS